MTFIGIVSKDQTERTQKKTPLYILKRVEIMCFETLDVSYKINVE